MTAATRELFVGYFGERELASLFPDMYHLPYFYLSEREATSSDGKVLHRETSFPHLVLDAVMFLIGPASEHTNYRMRFSCEALPQISDKLDKASKLVLEKAVAAHNEFVASGELI